MHMYDVWFHIYTRINKVNVFILYPFFQSLFAFDFLFFVSSFACVYSSTRFVLCLIGYVRLYSNKRIIIGIPSTLFRLQGTNLLIDIIYSLHNKILHFVISPRIAHIYKTETELSLHSMRIFILQSFCSSFHIWNLWARAKCECMCDRPMRKCVRVSRISICYCYCSWSIAVNCGILP